MRSFLNLFGSVAILGTLAAALPAAADEPANPVVLRIALVAPEEAAEPPRGTLRLRRVACRGPERERDAEPAERSVPVNSESVEVALPPATWWRIEAEIPGYWAREAVVAADGGETSLRLFPLGEVRVGTAVPRGEAAPGELTVHFVPAARGILLGPGKTPPERQDALRGEVACRGAAASGWSCELPAGEVDLRFHAPGFASEFFWKVRVPPRETADLGRLALVPGAALLGRLELPSIAELDPANVEVELAAETFDSLDPRTRRLGRTAALGEGGLFQFRDLAPGVYRLTARAEGWAPAERTSIEVRAGLETELIWPLELRRPAAVEICLDPPVPPGVRRPVDTWEVRLHPQTTELRQPPHGSVDGEGCWRRPDVQPGWYRLTVGDGRRSHWLERSVSIPSGDFRLDLELPLVAVEGSITRGGRPVRARLTFERLRPAGGEQPAEIRRLVFYSDPDGLFSGALTEEGRWWVKVAFGGGRTEQLLEAVEVEKPERGPFRIELEVPETRLAGRVVNEDGEGIARVMVLAHRLPVDPEAGSAAGSRTDAGADGRFELEGLAPGRYRVSAFTAGASATAEVEVEELAEPPEVELLIEEGGELAGQVVSARGPVIGARIFAHPHLERPRSIAEQSVISDVRGEFTLAVPADAISFRLLVFPPGYAARVLQVSADHEGPLVVAVDDAGGTLIVDGDGEGGHLYRSSLVAGDLPVGLTLFQDWSLLGTGEPPGLGGSWTLPMMSAGEYALCAPGGSPCDRGFLAPHDTLVLTLPSARERLASAGD